MAAVRRRTTLQLAELTIEIERKAVRYARLRVLADASIRLSLPLTMPLAEAHIFISSKLDWLRQARMRAAAQQPTTEALFNDGDLHDFWGRRLPLQLSEHVGRPRATLLPDRMLLQLPADHGTALRRALLDHWYRSAVIRALPPLLEHWPTRMGVTLNSCNVITMRTRWGSCTPARHSIRLNSQLARFAAGCLEYVLVHELAHLIEANHSSRFYAVLDQYLPDWQQRRSILNPAGRAAAGGRADEVD